MNVGKITPRNNRELSLMMFFIMITAAIILYILITGKYSSKIDVKGTVVREGTQLILSEQAGIVTNIYAKVGDYIEAGGILFEVTADSLNFSNEITSSTLKDQTKRTTDLIKNENEKNSEFIRLKKQEVERKNTYSKLINQEIKSLQNSLILMEKDLQLLEDKQNRFRKLFAAGALSKDSLNESILSAQQKRQEIISVTREVFNKEKELVSLSLEIQQIELSVIDASASHQRQIDSLSEKLDNLNKQSTYYIKAPFSGVLSFSNVYLNQRVVQSNPMATITNPNKNKLYVKLESDSKSLSYAKKNNEVVIRVDAFPYEEYGVLKGNITHISPIRLSSGGDDDKFNVIIEFNSKGKGTINPSWLSDGMTVVSTFSNAKLSLIEWLFLPVVQGDKRNPDYWD